MRKRRLRALSGEEKRLIQEDARRHIPLCELAEAYGVTSRTICSVLAEALPPIELPPVRPLPSPEKSPAKARPARRKRPLPRPEDELDFDDPDARALNHCTSECLRACCVRLEVTASARRGLPPTDASPWSASHSELLLKRFAAGEPLNKLSERLGRNEQALLSQLNKLLQKRGLEENT